MKKLILLFAAAALAAKPALAQKNNDTTARTFVIMASIGGLQEVVSGQLAAQKATDPAIKAFGTEMVTDHSKAQARLMQLAKANNIQVPPQAAGGQLPAPMLKNASGRDFDRLYVHMMVPDHRETIQLFQTYAIAGMNPDLKAFARETLPVLKEHLAMITVLDDNLKDKSAK